MRFETAPFQTKFNIFWMAFFALLAPLAFATGWASQTWFLTAISLWAVFGQHLGAWISARSSLETVEAMKADPDIPTKGEHPK